MKNETDRFPVVGVGCRVTVDRWRRPGQKAERSRRSGSGRRCTSQTQCEHAGRSHAGNPITSADIAWVDLGTERYYFADRSNFGVDIIDAETDFYVGRVSGMAGPLPSTGGTAAMNGPGPNGVLMTPNRKLWG